MVTVQAQKTRHTSRALGQTDTPADRARLLNPTETLLQNPPYCDETKLGFKKLTSRGFVSFLRFHYGFLRVDYARGLVQDICK